VRHATRIVWQTAQVANRKRRHLTDEEVAALRLLIQGRRPSPIGAYAALVAAIATLLSAVTAAVLAIVEQFKMP